MMLVIDAKCAFCGATHCIPVPTLGFNKRRNGLLPIQEAMPEVSAADREMLISGACPSCFDRVTAETGH